MRASRSNRPSNPLSGRSQAASAPVRLGCPDNNGTRIGSAFSVFSLSQLGLRCRCGREGRDRATAQDAAGGRDFVRAIVFTHPLVVNSPGGWLVLHRLQRGHLESGWAAVQWRVNIIKAGPS